MGIEHLLGVGPGGHWPGWRNASVNDSLIRLYFSFGPTYFIRLAQVSDRDD